MDSTPQPGLKVLMDRWSCPEVQALLSGPPPAALPTSGPLHELIQAACELWDDDSVNLFVKAVADRDLRFVEVLARIIVWLQQTPSPELHRSPDWKNSTWCSVVVNLAWPLSQISASTSRLRSLSCDTAWEDARSLALEHLDSVEGSSMYHSSIQCSV